MYPNRLLALLAIAALLSGCQSDSRPLALEPTRAAAAADAAMDGSRQNNAANRGAITIRLVTRGPMSGGARFAFDQRRFQLDPGNSDPRSAAQTFTNLKPASYGVRALTLPGASFATIRCTSTGSDNNAIDVTSGSVVIALEAGETVQCTFIGGWPSGSFVTYDQDAYGDQTSPGSVLLASHFNAVYPGGLEIGIPGLAGFSAVFQRANAIVDFLPQLDPPGTFAADLVDPTSTQAGTFGGEVVALALNVDLSDAAFLAGTYPTRIGDLYICDFSPLPLLNGQTVRQVLATSNTLVGGGVAPLTLAGANYVANSINGAFLGGSASSFAQANLFAGACP